MAKNETKRLSSVTLAEDEATFNALQNVTGYTRTSPC